MSVRARASTVVAVVVVVVVVVVILVVVGIIKRVSGVWINWKGACAFFFLFLIFAFFPSLPAQPSEGREADRWTRKYTKRQNTTFALTSTDYNNNTRTHGHIIFLEAFVRAFKSIQMRLLSRIFHRRRRRRLRRLVVVSSGVQRCHLVLHGFHFVRSFGCF